MFKKTKTLKDAENHSNDKTSENSDQEISSEKSENWSDDQKNKSYYYDDSYGYEVYNPDKEDEENTSNS